MFKFRRIDTAFNLSQGASWKPVAKISGVFFLLGYVLFVLKEIIVGILSLFCFGIGAYLAWVAIQLWRTGNR